MAAFVTTISALFSAESESQVYGHNDESVENQEQAMRLFRFPAQVLNLPDTNQEPPRDALFPSLPTEILEVVFFDNTDIFDRCALALTCKRFAAIMVQNRSLTWQNNADASALRPHNPWLSTSTPACYGGAPARAEQFGDLIASFPCVRSGFEQFQFFAWKYLPALPAWFEFRYCCACRTFRPWVHISPGREWLSDAEASRRVRLSTDKGLIDVSAIIKRGPRPYPRVETEPIFRESAWYLRSMPRIEWDVRHVCPACRSSSSARTSRDYIERALRHFRSEVIPEEVNILLDCMAVATFIVVFSATLVALASLMIDWCCGL